MLFLFTAILLFKGIHTQDVPNCDMRSNVALVLDRSESINNEEWEKAKEFSKLILEKINVTKNGNKAGVATFSTNSSIVFKCDAYTNLTSIMTAVDQIERKSKDNRMTNIQAGLENGEEIVNNCGNSGAKVIVLVTDGRANVGKDLTGPTPTAERIRGSGVTILALGIGQVVSEEELTGITGNSSLVFFEDSFEAVLKSAVITNLATSVCEAPTLTTQATTKTTPSPTTNPTSTTESSTTSLASIPSTTAEDSTTTAPTTTPPTTTAEVPTTLVSTTTATTTESPSTLPSTTETIATEISTKKVSSSTLKNTNFSSPAPCNCSAKASELRICCTSWTKEDVIANFKGACYSEKLIEAIRYLKERIDHFYEKASLFELCRKKLQEEIVIKENPVFSEYDECTVNIDCQLDKLINMLKLKKAELEKNLEYESSSYGDYFAGMYEKLWRKI